MIDSAPARSGLVSAACFLLGFGLIVWLGSDAIGEVRTPRGDLLWRLNAARAQASVGALSPDPRLARGARLRARDLAPRLRSGIAEPRPGPPIASLESRLASLERPSPAAAELHWLGEPDNAASARAIEQWLDDPASRAQLLDSAHAALGAVVFDTRAGQRVIYLALAPAAG